MAVVNPFADDPERAGPWEDGYLAGYAEPETDHLPPLEPELLEVFQQGEQTGRDDRRSEPQSQDPFPSAGSPEVTRFEEAPDGILIPIPDSFGDTTIIREDASVTINPRTAAGYYVVIYNGPPESHGEFEHFIGEVLTEVSIAQLEHMLARAVAEGAKVFVKFGGLFISVAISVLTPSPILKESRFRGYLDDDDLTPISYVVLDPQ